MLLKTAFKVTVVSDEDVLFLGRFHPGVLHHFVGSIRVDIAPKAMIRAEDVQVQDAFRLPITASLKVTEP